MVRRRILVEKRRKIQATGAVVAFVSVNGSNLRSDPAHNEVLEDWRHFISLFVFRDSSMAGLEKRDAISSPPFSSQKPGEKGGAPRSGALSRSLLLANVTFNVNLNLSAFTTLICEMRELSWLRLL